MTVTDAKQETPQPVYRKDYREPDYWIDRVHLDFDLHEEKSIVNARIELRRNENVNSGDAALVLVGEDLVTEEIKLDGRVLAENEYSLTKERLTIPGVPDSFVLETRVSLEPQNNTQLSGLYKSSGNFCTQCEAEGFRRITWFHDRPDVMAKYTVRVEADKAKYPVLLSNGNRLEAGELAGGRHFTRWEDPYVKPSYLFALVAGNLKALAGNHTTTSGREVKLEIWVEEKNLSKCGHALEALKKSMQWDEQTYGLEYDLDLYMIVAVDDFNMGAMENKGLNVFNSKLVLASQETATDADYERIESVVAHEYFHNWTGNRVTCRDWFQLTLKEGLTVYRDQRFTADMTSETVKRIDDVRHLREAQFAEADGPMSHPVRPESYVSMDNFYTITVYEKGAAVVRMYEMLLGRAGFRAGMDLYFERHDGGAVTCDDFRAAMADANSADLSQFERWYTQAGTPTLHAAGVFDAAAKTYTLTLRQEIPQATDESAPEPMLIPIAVGLVGPDGADMPLQMVGEDSPAAETTRMLVLSEKTQTHVFIGIESKPVPSVLRGFSAPVKLLLPRSSEELAFLMANDSDGFNRWDAGQTLARRLLLKLADDHAAGDALSMPDGFVAAFGRILADDSLDGSYRAVALGLPSERELGLSQEVVNPDSLHAAREYVVQQLASGLRAQWMEIFEATRSKGAYSADKSEIDRRRLHGRALGYLTSLEEPAYVALAKTEFDAADNMTDSQSALGCLVQSDAPERAEALAAFFERWKEDPLVLDKWFTLQALTSLPTALEEVTALAKHPSFTLKNPNRARSLISAFGLMNQVRFHQADGAGYRFVADQVLAIDEFNPQLAARVVSAFNRWRSFDTERQGLMKTELRRIAAKDGLSKDTGEIVGRALKGA
ncbi:MAG: aminopeptidase N [Planctomycetota bacterium]|jgi:aminopeptidase N